MRARARVNASKRNRAARPRKSTTRRHANGSRSPSVGACALAPLATASAKRKAQAKIAFRCARPALAIPGKADLLQAAAPIKAAQPSRPCTVAVCAGQPEVRAMAKARDDGCLPASSCDLKTSTLHSRQRGPRERRARPRSAQLQFQSSSLEENLDARDKQN